MRSIQPGCLVEFLQSNTPVLVYVLEAHQNKIRVLSPTLRESKLSPSRILPWIGPCFDPDLSRQDIVELLLKHTAIRQEYCDAIDALEIWELAHGEVEKADLSWFAGLLWDDPSPDQIASMGSALLRCKTHFKFVPPNFSIFSQEQVAKRLQKLEKEQHDEKLISLGQELFHNLFKDKLSPDEIQKSLQHPSSKELKEILLKLLADPNDGQARTLWSKVRQSLPDDPFLPLILAQKWGVLPYHHNHLLDRIGYAWGDDWSLEHEDEILRIKSICAESQPDELLHEFVSIDSETTEDRDDAFVFTKTNRGFTLCIALSCPVIGWDFSGPLNRAVFNRASSLYLPEGSSHMLPETLGTDFFSLTEKKPRPALVLEVLFDTNGTINSFSPSFSWIEVKSNSNYEDIQKELASAQCSETLKMALDMANKLKEKRITQRACLIDQLHPDIILEGKGIDTNVLLTPAKVYPDAHTIVSEFMILANTLIAEYAIENDLPVLFRTQDITLPKDGRGEWTDPVTVYQLIRCMAPALLEAEPKPHATLGVSAYAPISSPLRRYTDLVNMAQVTTFLRHNTHCFSRAELESMVPSLSSRLDNVAQVQRFRPRYWKLLFIQQHQTDSFRARLVDNSQTLYVLSMPDQQILIRASKDLFSKDVSLGQDFYVWFSHVDPLRNELIVSKIEPFTSDEE